MDPAVPVQNVESTSPLLANGAVFCKMCSASSQEKHGDTCWGLIPADDTNRDCGCNSGGWTGHGVYYAGFEDCNTCGCRAPNAFSGPKEDHEPKGGVSNLHQATLVVEPMDG